MTIVSPKFQAVTNALHDAIAAAPERERNALAQALEDYAAARPATYADVRRMPWNCASACVRLPAIEDAYDAWVEGVYG